MPNYNNRAYMHDYCSIFAFIQVYVSTDVHSFLVKMCKTKHFLYFVNFCNYWCNYFKGVFGYCLFYKKKKIENSKYCNKIIFKCANNIVGHIFNKNFNEKRG